MKPEAEGPVETESQMERTPPGESMACLQIALGIWGTLLLAVPIAFSWHRHVATMAGALVLLAGTLLPLIGGVLGLKASKQRRGLAFMTAGDAILTLSAIVLLIMASGGDISWYFPLGALFLTLAFFADLALYLFRRAVRAVEFGPALGS
jgi:hypothetical protein